jgi:hypothetical protein
MRASFGVPSRLAMVVNDEGVGWCREDHECISHQPAELQVIEGVLEPGK